MAGRASGEKRRKELVRKERKALKAERRKQRRAEKAGKEEGSVPAEESPVDALLGELAAGTAPALNGAAVPVVHGPEQRERS